MEEATIDRKTDEWSRIKKEPQQGVFAFCVGMFYLSALIEIGDDSFYLISHHAALVSTWLSLISISLSIALYFRGWWKNGIITAKDGSKVDASFRYFSGAIMLILAALVEHQHTVVAACKLRHDLAP